MTAGDQKVTSGAVVHQRKLWIASLIHRRPIKPNRLY